jgi:predicted transposase YbfD/YdcC
MLPGIGFQLDPDSVWSNLKSVGMVESIGSVDDKTTVETRYFLSSLESNGEQLANSVRSHWAIENSLHWVLDVALKQDDYRIRKER